MREAFEKWAIETGKKHNYAHMDRVLKRDGEDGYTTAWVDSAWLGWQACWEYCNGNH